MEQLVFVNKDVKEFMTEYVGEWTGQIYDRKNEDAKIPTNEDFGKVQQFICVSTNDKLIDKEILVSNFQFIVYIDHPMIDEDLSVQWVQFLLKKYGKDYAKKVFDWSIKNMVEIKKETTSLIKKFTQQKLDEEKLKLDHFNEFADASMKFLKDEDIVDSHETFNIF